MGRVLAHAALQGRGERAELDKAVRQLAVIDEAIASAASADCKARLRMLRCRIAAEKDHIELDHKFEKYPWADLPGAMESWVHNFTYRVNDISSLGNVDEHAEPFRAGELCGQGEQPAAEVGHPAARRRSWPAARGQARSITWTNEETEAKAASTSTATRRGSTRRCCRFRNSATRTAATASIVKRCGGDGGQARAAVGAVDLPGRRGRQDSAAHRDGVAANVGHGGAAGVGEGSRPGEPDV